MGAGQSQAELFNPRLARLDQVPRRTADREDPKFGGLWYASDGVGQYLTQSIVQSTASNLTLGNQTVVTCE